MSRGLIVLLVLELVLVPLAGCTNISSWGIDAKDLPSNIAWLGVFVEGSSGASGTGFVHRYEGRFRVFDQIATPADRIWVVGFTADRFLSLNPPGEAALRTKRLSRAGPSDALLPRPDWIGEGGAPQDRIEVSTAGDPLPDLTVSWLPPCPQVITATIAYVDWPCFGIPCQGRAAQTNCDLTIDFDSCTSGTFHGHIDARGRASLGNPFSGDCHLVQPDPGAQAALTCESPIFPAGGCTGEIYQPASAPRFDVASVSVSPLPYVNPGPPADALSGELVGLGVLPDRIATIAYKSFMTAGECGDGDFMFIDPETLSVFRTAPAPQCLVDLVADPGGGGFLGLRWTPAFEIIRFDQDGRMLESAQLPGAMYPMGADFPRSLAVARTQNRAAMVFAGSLSTVMPSVAAFFTVRPLAFEKVVSGFGSGALPAGFLDDGRLAVVERLGSNRGVSMRIVDPVSGALSALPTADRPCTSAKIVDASASPMRQTVIASTRGMHRSILLFNATTPASCQEIVAYESPSAPAAAHPWPQDQSKFLVGLDSLDNGDVDPTRVALLDAATGHYLVGAQVVGRGPVRAMDVDPKGRVWLMLPWDGRVVRVSAR